MSEQEQILIRQAQNGDVASFEELIRNQQARLMRLILAIAGNAEDAEDALQETLLQVYRALPGFRGESSFSTWLFRIAINRTRNWLRAQGRASSERFAVKMVGAIAGSVQQVEAEVVNREDRRLVRASLLKLPEHYRRAILLRHYLDMSYEEIAEILAIPVGTVRSRLAQGRKLLMQQMDMHGYRPLNEGE